MLSIPKGSPSKMSVPEEVGRLVYIKCINRYEEEKRVECKAALPYKISNTQQTM